MLAPETLRPNKYVSMQFLLEKQQTWKPLTNGFVSPTAGLTSEFAENRWNNKQHDSRSRGLSRLLWSQISTTHEQRSMTLIIELESPFSTCEEAVSCQHANVDSIGKLEGSWKVLESCMKTTNTRKGHFLHPPLSTLFRPPDPAGRRSMQKKGMLTKTTWIKTPQGWFVSGTDVQLAFFLFHLVALCWLSASKALCGRKHSQC